MMRTWGERIKSLSQKRTSRSSKQQCGDRGGEGRGTGGGKRLDFGQSGAMQCAEDVLFSCTLETQ